MAAGDEAPDAPPPQPRSSTEKPPIFLDGSDGGIDDKDSNAGYDTSPGTPVASAGRSSIDKAPRSRMAALPPFERLPDEIIQQILLATDSNAFASLVLLNSKWRTVSQQAHLYAHHLARTPTFLASNYKSLFNRLKSLQQSAQDGSTTAADQQDRHDRLLADLRRAFARQVKRCRFDAYLRPSRTLVRLVSNSISSSSAPGGEGMQFQASPRGHHLLAYNSSRIYVLDVRSAAAPHGVEVVRELKVLRRPAATCIRDDASVLAVLLTEMQVDLYDLQKSPPRRIQSIILDHSPRAIALSPCGSVLAAAYEGGIEVSSLRPGALATDRRAVKCDHVDALAFSFDGTQILGTSVHAAQPNTVILTAPYYDPGSQMSSDDLSALWTTSILFPNTSRDCSHAVLLQDSSREEAFWTFAYDRSFETFRAVRIDDLRNGTTYFTGPIPTAASPARLLPCTLPSASYHGDLVSAGFQGKDIWLYGVPEDLDAVPTSPGNNCNSSSGDSSNDSSMDPGAPGGFEGMSGSGASAMSTALGGGSSSATNGGSSASGGASSGGNGGSMSRANSGSPSMRAASARLQESGSDSSVRVPQWQLLCDRQRNTFIAGSRVGELPGVSMVNWVEGFGDSSLRERLVVGARGVHPPQPISSDDDGIDFIDGGRLLLVDFDYGTTDGETTEITIEVGSKEPEVLEEEHRDIDTEVAIVRRRTVAQKRGKPGALMRNATTAGVGAAHSNPVVPLPAMPALPSSFSQGARPAHASNSRPLASSSLRNATNSSTNHEDDDDDPLVPRRMAAPPTTRQQGSALGAAARTPAVPLLPGSAAAAAAAAAESGMTTDSATTGTAGTTAEVNHSDRAETESVLGEEEQESIEAFDAPYSQGSPRSGVTLRRAATAAAINRRRNPPPATTSSGAPIVYRRADGRREHPHESDADNWVPPPPPYQKDIDPHDLPAFLRHNVPPVVAPPQPVARPAPSATAAPTMSAAAPPPATLATSTSLPPSIPGVGATLGLPNPDLAVENTAAAAAATVTTQDPSRNDESEFNDDRPVSRESDTVPSGDLYEASPPGSPHVEQRPPTGLSTTNESAGAASQLPPQTQPPQTQQQQASTGSVSTTGPPVLDLQIPAQTGGSLAWDPSAPQPLPPQQPFQPQPPQQQPPQQVQDSYGNFVPKPVAYVQTWPMQRPSVSNASGVGFGVATGPTGGMGLGVGNTSYPVSYPVSYPYSAPPVAQPAAQYPATATTTANTSAQAPASSEDFSSPPGQGLASQQEAVSPLSPNRFSMNSFLVPRVPVGSNRQSRRSSMQRPSTGIPPGPGPALALGSSSAAAVSVDNLGLNKPLPYLQPQQDVNQAFQQLQLQQQQPQPQQQPQYYFQPPLMQPQRAFSNPVVSSSSPSIGPVEDQPLIISTPRGVTGAFDPPKSKSKSGLGRFQDGPGGSGNHHDGGADDDDDDDGPAPVIFAPVPRHPQAQERNAELRERLETLSGGGTPVKPAQKPLILPYTSGFYAQNGTAAAPTSATLRQPSLNRKQSRAERSAAKNMADAKKRGWRRSNSKKKKKGKEAASTATVDTSVPVPPLPPPASIGSSTVTAVPGKSRRGKKAAAASVAPSVAPSDAMSGLSALPTTTDTTSRRRGKRKKERDFDAASSAWTDITTTTAMMNLPPNMPPNMHGPAPGSSGSYYQPPMLQQQQQQYLPPMPSIPGGGPGSSSAYAMQQLQQHIQQQQQMQQQMQQESEKKGGKCIVM
ncbi:hypothetical protein HMPREF1624_03192 [Sporothrix schenckii ATCC 58251]|uniref:F-box domain-containing protein n=1 Tax=Sporothrix schenckii (strain ATCC 58251 / de Perez 2211183) TaxID=1391915 RepID=U7PW47_SPOS1|nr:hypothetical protein HMPREF1624_03192 [Sporothrix schenckii ATCC 58251]